MKFDSNKLNDYQQIIKTTNILESYQEFIKLFRYLKIQLQKELPEFSTSNNIMENHLDFAYFQLFKDSLKDRGLKVQIIFVHQRCQFELWISGYNRKIQNKYYLKLKDRKFDYLLTSDPQHIDYIFKSQLSTELDISDGEKLISLLKEDILEIVSFAESI